jgi:hypothetical protein
MLPRDGKERRADLHSCRWHGNLTVTDHIRYQEGTDMTSTQAEVVRISPPADAGPDDDPRDLVYIPAKDIIINRHEQRAVSPVKLAAMKARGEAITDGETAIVWEILEGVTVAERDDGRFVAVEGQHRVELIKAEKPGARIWAPVAPGGRLTPAEIALLIATLRTSHTPFARYELLLRQDDPMAVAIQVTLEAQTLFATPNSDHKTEGSRNIAAIGALTGIVRSMGDVNAGRELLDTTLAIMDRGFEGRTARWTAPLITAVAEIIRRNDAQFAGELSVDYERLVARLRTRKPADWEAGAAGRPGTKSRAIAMDVMSEYNIQKSKHLRLDW